MFGLHRLIMFLRSMAPEKKHDSDATSVNSKSTFSWTDLTKYYRKISDDLEIDKSQSKLIVRSQYMCKCSYFFARLFYPIQQWFSIMYYDVNPYKTYMRCVYCSEQFDPIDKVVITKDCNKQHMYHQACIDLLVMLHKRYNKAHGNEFGA